MENYRLPVLVSSILGCMLIIFVILLNIHQFQLIRGNSQLLSVSAIGKAESIQDVATVTVGVVTEGQTSQIVKDQNSTKMNQVITFIKQTGIEDKDIKTSQFYISPKYSYNNQQQTVVGYQANQTITVKVRNVDKSSQQLEGIVDGAVTHGANQINGIDFSYGDDDALVQTARKQGIDKAIANARLIAKDAGLNLGGIVNVITSTSGNAQPIFADSNMALAKSASPQIELGSQEVFANVTVVFKLR